MKTLKFVIPRTAASVAALIDSLSSELVILGGQVVTTTIGAPAPGAAAAVSEQDNTNVVQLNSDDDGKKSGDSADLAPASGVTGANVVVIAPGEKATGTAGIVEVDADGIPWDARIHGSAKSTLKKGGTWKLARGTDPALVETVITELKQTMAAAPAKIDYEAENADIEKQAAAETTTAAPAPKAPAPKAPAPAVVEPDPIYIVEGSGEFTADALLASGWSNEQIATLQVKPVETVVNTTSDKAILFPDLMAAVTAAGIDEATVLIAVQNQGIQATPLLAARPDLVPAVYAELFPA